MAVNKLQAKSLATTLALFAVCYIILSIVAGIVARFAGGQSKFSAALVVLLISVLAAGAYFAKNHNRLFSRSEKLLFILGAVLISMATNLAGIAVSGNSVEPSAFLVGAVLAAVINLIVIWLAIGMLAPRLYKKWLVET